MDIEIQMRIGRNFRTLRMTRKEGQTEIAKKLALGKKRYGNIERGKRMPDVPTLYAASQLYGISMDMLLHEDVHEILNDYFPQMHRMWSDSQFLSLYNKLSASAQNQVLSKAKSLLEEEAAYRRETFRIQY